MLLLIILAGEIASVFLAALTFSAFAYVLHGRADTGILTIKSMDAAIMGIAASKRIRDDSMRTDFAAD